MNNEKIKRKSQQMQNYKDNHTIKMELIEKMAVHGIFIHETAHIPLTETLPDRPHRFKTPSCKGNNPNEWKGWFFVQRDDKSIYGAFGSRDLTDNSGYGYKIYLTEKDVSFDGFQDITADMTDEEYTEFSQKKAEAERKREEQQEKEREEREAQRKKELEEAKREKEEIFTKINQKYMVADSAEGHEYLEKKQISETPEDVKRLLLPLSFKKEKSVSADTCIVPLYDAGAYLNKFEKRINTFQLIRKVPIKQEDGQYKSLMKKGFPIAGKGIYVFGSVRDGKAIVLVEGWATGEIIHRATGYCVIVAFSASGMPAFSKDVRKSNPNSLILIAQDNDEAGEKFCKQAMTISKGILVDAGNKKQGYDFSDLYLDEGIDAVRSIFEKAVSGTYGDDVQNDCDASDALKTEEKVLSHKPNVPVNPRSASYICLDKIDKNASNTKTNGKLHDTLDAFQEVSEMCGIEYRQNEITGDLQIVLPNEHLYPLVERRSLDDKTTIVKSAIESFGGGIKEIPNKISAMGSHNAFNPITNWIKSLKWDGVDRFPELMKALSFKEEENRPLYEKVWLSQLIYAVATWTDITGHKSNGCIILTGKGASGKSTFISTLLPETLDGMDTYRSMSMPSLDNKDSVIQASTCPLVEIPEIDKATKSEKRSRDGKAFLDQKENFVRRAYDRFETKIQRRSVIFGTANHDELLSDMTGNRKYIPMAVHTCDIYHETNMQQLYAQLYVQYVEPWIRAGRPRRTPWEFGRELIEALEDLSRDCIELPASVLAFQEAFDLSVPMERWNDFMNARTALVEAGIKEPSTQQSTELNAYMASIGAVRKRRSTGSGWFFPPMSQGGGNGGFDGGNRRKKIDTYNDAVEGNSLEAIEENRINDSYVTQEQAQKYYEDRFRVFDEDDKNQKSDFIPQSLRRQKTPEEIKERDDFLASVMDDEYVGMMQKEKKGSGHEQ